MKYPIEDYLECLIILVQNNFEKPERLKSLFEQLNRLTISDITQVPKVDKVLDNELFIDKIQKTEEINSSHKDERSNQ